MKCKHCNGTGTTNWCVNGTFVDCPYCGGTGEIEVTKEEWLCQLNTVEKAEIIAQLSSYGGNVEAILEWLKQPHTFK
jgi:hypothetical protein